MPTSIPGCEPGADVARRGRSDSTERITSGTAARAVTPSTAIDTRQLDSWAMTARIGIRSR
jgi:hypothetical protein